MEVWFEIWETIKRHKLRTAITGFSVGWGIFLIVVLLSVGNGLGNGVAGKFQDDAVNSIWLWPGKTALPHDGLQKGRSLKLTNEDFEYLKENLDGVEYISARFDKWGSQNIAVGSKSSGFSVKGAHPDYKHIEKTEIRQGRYINEKDIEEQRKVAIVGEPVAEFFFPEQNAIGRRISINGTSYAVAGVFYDDGGDRENRMIHIPVTTAQVAFSQLNHIDRIMFTIGDSGLEESKRMEQQARKLMAQKLNFDPRDPQAIGLRNNFESFKRFDDLILFIKYFVGFVGIMTLIAGVVGVGNILLITVKERTREFGVRRAIGATPFSIVSLILLESISITFVSGYIGLLLGVGLIELINATIPDMGFISNPNVDLNVVSAALGVLVFTGALTGIFPALRAVSINPIEALRA